MDDAAAKIPSEINRAPHEACPNALRKIARICNQGNRVDLATILHMTMSKLTYLRSHINEFSIADYYKVFGLDDRKSAESEFRDLVEKLTRHKSTKVKRWAKRIQGDDHSLLTSLSAEAYWRELAEKHAATVVTGSFFNTMSLLAGENDKGTGKRVREDTAAGPSKSLKRRDISDKCSAGKRDIAYLKYDVGAPSKRQTLAIRTS
ncbi:hypothetical protein EC973_009675 [Apophysomyces ossiformis]|uniref:Uncharacterized protein n=1 Tax=Apophysomyces ossiformis TaxID=679940 RepID=A0A8H7EQ63_9FUNG|nr:hypothetical protein EC973_009675 [Apophysomyces ossiformis]